MAVRHALLLFLATYLVRQATGTNTLSNIDCMLTQGDDGPQATCIGGSDIPTGLPEHLRKLTLTNSTLTVLKTGVLSHLPRLAVLDLSGNTLTHLRPGAFRGLQQLKHLNLAHNRLCFGDDAFPADAFLDVATLRVLIMHSNECPTGHVAYPEKALGELIRLETLAMNGLPNIPLGSGFARMTSLRSLELSGKYCNLGVVSRNTFTSLENTSISQLSLRACNITTLAETTFTPLPSLVSLNLACNERIGFEKATKAIGKSTSTSLDTVVLDDISLRLMVLNNYLFVSRQFSNVRRLSVRANNIGAVDIETINNFPAVRSLAVGFNDIYGRKDFFHSDIQMGILHYVITNVEVIDVSYLISPRATYRRIFCEPDHVDFDDYFREKPRLPDVIYPRFTRSTTHEDQYYSLIPDSLQVLYFDHSDYNSHRFRLPKFNVSKYNDIVVLNLSNTYMDVIKGPLIGFSKLQVLDFRRCCIYKINPGALRQLGCLKYLYLQHNVIGEKGHGIADQFHGLHSLLELDLSDNKIPSIERNAFRDMTNIRKLNLRGNRLTVLDFSISRLSLVEFIDVSHNVLVYGSTGFLDDSAILGNTTEINLMNNPFICNCSSAAFVRWLRATYVNLTYKNNLSCVNDSGHTMVMIGVDELYLPQPCHVTSSNPLLYIVITVCLLLVIAALIITIALILYRKRRETTSKVEYRICDNNIRM